MNIFRKIFDLFRWLVSRFKKSQPSSVQKSTTSLPVPVTPSHFEPTGETFDGMPVYTYLGRSYHRFVRTPHNCFVPITWQGFTKR